MAAADCWSHRVVGSALCGVSLGTQTDDHGAEEQTYLGFADHIGFAASVQADSRMMAAVQGESRCGCSFESRPSLLGLRRLSTLQTKGLSRRREWCSAV
jgi:hypothetical protein